MRFWLLVLLCLVSRLALSAPADTTALHQLNRRIDALQQTDPALGLTLAKQGQRQARAAQLPRWEVRFALQQVDYLIDAGRHPEAQRICGAAWQQARTLGDWTLQANVLARMGQIIVFQGDTATGLRTMHEAAAAARRAGPPAQKLLFDIEQNLTMLFFNQPNGLAAATRLLEGQQAAARRNPALRELMSPQVGNLVHFYRLAHRYDAALAVGREGLAWARAARKPDDETHTLNAMAWALADAGRWAEALPLIRQANTLGQQPAVAAERRMDAQQQLTRIEAGLQHWQEAYRAQEAYHALVDSVRGVESARATAALTARYDTERKEAHIRELTQQQRIARVEATAQAARNRLLLALVGGLVLALGVFGALYWQLRRSRRRLATSETELRRANQTKDQLMSIIGHDLRSPMASFQQLPPLLRALADEPAPTELREVAAEVEGRARQVSALVDNLLHWARAQAGQVTSRPQDLRVQEVVQPILHLFGPLAAAKQVQLREEVSPTAPARFRADPHLLATVLRNLVSNAIKFTPAGGTVTVAVGEAAEGVVFRVRDTGVGIPASRLAQLFEAAERTSTTGTAGEGGTGLGLLVCDEFVRRLGGQLRVESRAGQGTSFAFALPATQPVPVG